MRNDLHLNENTWYLPYLGKEVNHWFEALFPGGRFAAQSSNSDTVELRLEVKLSAKRNIRDISYVKRKKRATCTAQARQMEFPLSGADIQQFIKALDRVTLREE